MATTETLKVENMTPEQMADALYLLGVEAQKSREQKSDAIEVKMARAARLLLTTPDAFGASIPPGVNKWLESATTLAPEAFDRMEGDLIASIFTNLSALPEQFRPAGFDKVADKVESLVEAWNASKPGRRAGNGTGESTTPANQKLSTFGIESITLTFESDKLDAPVSITHGSTWSSLSAEINKVAKRVDGKVDAAPGEYSYQKVDASAGPAWRAYVEAVKVKPDASGSFTVKLGKGTLKVSAQGKPMSS